MKQKTKLLNWMPSGILALILAGSTSTALAQLDIAIFDTDTSEISGTGGAVTPTVTWDSTGNPGGSAYVTIPWVDKTGWQDAQISFNRTVDAGLYLNFEFDIKVDIANSTLTDSGDYGGYQLACQNWAGGQGWTVVGSGTIANTPGWQHFSASLASYSGTLLQAIVAFDANQYGGTPPHAGTCKYWLDNVKFTAVPVYVPPPTLQQPMPAPKHAGLTLLPATQSQYQRVMVYPATALGTAFGWYNSANFPVSYSFTIVDFPNLPNYGAQVFWIPNNAMELGVADTSVDWNMTNGMVLSISANATNPPTGWGVTLAVKTNLSGANPNLTITNFSYGSLPLGTWTVTFNNNTDFTITAPDSSVVSASLPADVADLVSGNANGSTAMTPYFGIQNNNLIGIGHPAVFSNISISNVITNGVAGTLEDSFNTGSLDTNKWAKLTDKQADITVNSGNLAWYLAWNMPNDNGYGPLQAASSLLGPWVDFSPASSWIVVNGTNRTATITTSDLQSKLGETDIAFFRLIKRAFTKLQILLPGETAAPNTPSGKTGTPLAQSVGVPFDVIVNSVDADWNVVNGANDAIAFTSTGDFQVYSDPTQPSLSGGTVTATLEFLSGSGPATITATDYTDGSKTADTSSSVSY